jgi:uncharacterized phage infection (PIP) family protein YhgE
MADDLSAAPSTGASEPVSAPAPEASSPAKDTAPKAPSTREALKEAMRTVEARSPNETDKARAVLKDGAGADDAATEADRKAKSDANDTIGKNETAAERAKKGWETRRENAKAAEATDKQAEAIGKVVGEKVAEAVKPAEAKPADEAKTAPAETKYKEPPQRFASTAKAEWEKTPEPVRAEIDRSIKELESGLQKYKQSAERFEELAEYEQLSQQFYRQPLKETLKNYAELDRSLNNPETNLATLERLVSGMKYVAADGETYNWDMRQLAEYVLQQTDQGVDSFQDPQADLKRELADVKKQLSEFQQGFTQQRETERERTTQTLQEQINEFATQNARFDELWQDVELELHNPRFAADKDPLSRLKLAYEKVERLNPAPSLAPPAPALAAPDATAQTRRASASVTGAPGAGSNPAKKPVPSSSRDALKAAFAAKGLSF